jgi:hypothetical protein
MRDAPPPTLVRIIVLAAVLAASADAFAAGAPVAPLHSDAINLILGDESFTRRFHRPVPPGFDPNVRVRVHLEYVLEHLRARPSHELAPALRAARRRNLGRLAAYIARGEFPRNDDHPDPMRPTFIDARGRTCAVGYLIEQDLGRAVAEVIAARYKYAFIREIDSPLLAGWAARSGLSLAELEMIQPGYPRPASAAPAPSFGTLDRVDGETQLAVSTGWVRDDAPGAPARLDLFGQYVWRHEQRSGPFDTLGIGAYVAAALAAGATPSGLGNLELGLLYVAEQPPHGRWILRSGVLLPTGADVPAEPGASPVAIRLGDAVLVEPSRAGARLGLSRLVIANLPYPVLQTGWLERYVVRLDGGVDMLVPRGGDVQAAPRGGIGIGLQSGWFALLAEGSAAWHTSGVHGRPSLHTLWAATLRLVRLDFRNPLRWVQPGVTVAFPRGAGETGWVLGLDLQVRFGPSTHDPNWHEWPIGQLSF